MHVPSPFREADRATLLDFISARSFGTLIVATAGMPEIAHLPFLVEPGAAGDSIRLTCHVARANPIWRLAEEAGRGVASFMGPDAYVSPDWYASANQVPTWNFAAVQASGALRLLSEAETRAHLADLAAGHEAALAPKTPWTMAALSDDREAALRGAIVGIAVEVEALQGKFKLSQNRRPEDGAGVVRALRARGGEDARAIADMMERAAGAD